MARLSRLLIVLFLFSLTISKTNACEDGQQQKPTIDQDEAVKPRRIPPSLQLKLDDPFDRMIKELRSLNVKGDVELWCKSIGDYYWSSRWNTDYTTLAQ